MKLHISSELIVYKSWINCKVVEEGRKEVAGIIIACINDGSQQLLRVYCISIVVLYEISWH